MILTVFRSRLNPNLKPAQLQELMQMDGSMSALAKTMPGYISHKAFAATDGERVVIVEFESEPAQLAFARHPAHLEAIQMGRQGGVLLEYCVQVCNVQREMGTPG